MNKIISLFSLSLLFAQTVSAQVPSTIIDSLDSNNVRVNQQLESENGFGDADGEGLSEVLGFWSVGSNNTASTKPVSNQDFIALSTIAMQLYAEIFKVDVDDYLASYRNKVGSDYSISSSKVLDPYYLILQMDDYFEEVIEFIATDQQTVEDIYNQNISDWNAFVSDVATLQQGNEYLNMDMHKVAISRLVTLRKVRDAIIGCNAASGCSKEFHYGQDPRCPDVGHGYGNAVIWPGTCLDDSGFIPYFIDADNDGYRRNGEYVEWLPEDDYDSFTASTENDCDDGNPDQYDLFQGHCPVTPASYTNECGVTVFCALDQGISLPCVLAPNTDTVQSQCDNLRCNDTNDGLVIDGGYDDGLLVSSCEEDETCSNGTCALRACTASDWNDADSCSSACGQDAVTYFGTKKDGVNCSGTSGRPSNVCADTTPCVSEAPSAPEEVVSAMDCPYSYSWGGNSWSLLSHQWSACGGDRNYIAIGSNQRTCCIEFRNALTCQSDDGTVYLRGDLRQPGSGGAGYEVCLADDAYLADGQVCAQFVTSSEGDAGFYYFEGGDHRCLASDDSLCNGINREARYAEASDVSLGADLHCKTECASGVYHQVNQDEWICGTL